MFLKKLNETKCSAINEKNYNRYLTIILYYLSKNEINNIPYIYIIVLNLFLKIFKIITKMTF